MKDLTVQQISKLISADKTSEKKRLAKIGQKYYEGEHDILQYRVFYYNEDGDLVEDRARSNERISHPFFTELADQLTSYLLSDTENRIITSNAEGLQDYLDKYFDDEFTAELADCITDGYVKGFGYLYGYKNSEDKIRFQYADCMGIVEVREKDTDAGCQAIIYSYVDRIDYGKTLVTRIQVHYADKIAYYVQLNEGQIEPDEDVIPNPCPNVIYKDEKGQLFGGKLGYIPFWRFDYNRKQISGLKPIKAIIDDYDLMQCGLSNNLQDFDNPLYVVKGFKGNSGNFGELQQNLKTKRMVGVNDSGDIDIKTIQVPYEARKTKSDEDKNNIYRFGMGIDTQSLKDTSATTNLAIQAAYTLLDLKAKKVINNLKKFLKQLVKVVIDEINEQNKTGYSVDDVDITFHPNMLLNESENIANDKIKAETKQIEINTILNAAAQIGDEETLKAICETLDLEFDDLKHLLDEKDPYSDAQSALNEVMIDE